jgi:hypothetical protein
MAVINKSYWGVVFESVWIVALHNGHTRLGNVLKFFLQRLHRLKEQGHIINTDVLVKAFPQQEQCGEISLIQ